MMESVPGQISTRDPFYHHYSLSTGNIKLLFKYRRIIDSKTILGVCDSVYFFSKD